LISGNPELGLRSFLFREEHDGQTPRPASYSKVRAGYFNRLLALGLRLGFQRMEANWRCFPTTLQFISPQIQEYRGINL
jgi:hypothetical protein